MTAEMVYVVTDKAGKLLGVCRSLDATVELCKREATLRKVMDITGMRIIKGDNAGSIYAHGMGRLDARPADMEFKYRCVKLT